MSLSNAAFKVAPTSHAASGGTADNLESVYDDSKTHQLQYGSGSFLERTVVEFSRSQPQKNSASPGGYTQARGNLVIKQPIDLGDGEITMNTARLTVATAVQSTDAQKKELLDSCAQFIYGTDTQGFWMNLYLG